MLGGFKYLKGRCSFKINEISTRKLHVSFERIRDRTHKHDAMGKITSGSVGDL